MGFYAGDFRGISGGAANGGVKSLGDWSAITQPGGMALAPATRFNDMFGRPVPASGGRENGPGGYSGSSFGGGNPYLSSMDTQNPNDPANFMVPGYAAAYRQAGQASAYNNYNQGSYDYLNQLRNNNVLAGKVNAISPLVSQMFQGFGNMSNQSAANPYSGGFQTNFGMSVNPYAQVGNPQVF